MWLYHILRVGGICITVNMKRRRIGGKNERIKTKKQTGRRYVYSMNCMKNNKFVYWTQFTNKVCRASMIHWYSRWGNVRALCTSSLALFLRCVPYDRRKNKFNFEIFNMLYIHMYLPITIITTTQYTLHLWIRRRQKKILRRYMQPPRARLTTNDFYWRMFDLKTFFVVRFGVTR